MIRGVERTAIAYVLEDDRGNAVAEQTSFFITPKTGHESNKSLQRYASAQVEGRGGKRNLNIAKLDAADVEEFLSIVSKVENYVFPKGSAFYNDDKATAEINDAAQLTEVCKTLSPEYLQEIFDAANNIGRLTEGQKKG